MKTDTTQGLDGKTYSMAPLYEPTPEEIRELCLGIQATWTEADRRKRCVYPDDEPVETALLKTPDTST